MLNIHSRLKDNHLVCVVLATDISRTGIHERVLIIKLLHGFVKLQQVLVAQKWIVGKLHLPASVVVAEVVPLSWKVKPLRVTKLIPYEVEICLAP